MQDKKNKHPYGMTLLSRDNEENRKLWGPSGVGRISVAESVCTADGQCPYYQHKEEDVTQTPIHLLIASFRDRLCPRTLHNAFSRAENARRLFIRLIDQTQTDSDLIDDAPCWDRYCQEYNPNCQEYKSQVRTVHIDASQAKGPTGPRSKLSAMIYWDYMHHDNDDIDLHQVSLDDFCMQTDSHMDFSDHWDTELIRMHHLAQNDYAVLSTYVADISQNNQDGRVVPNLCMVRFTSTIRNWGTKECTNLVRPKLTNAMWGAGLSFHRCHAEIQVPVDPYLDNIFDGEEGSRGIRFFTHGYDVYTPHRVLVTHDYKTHQSNPVVHTWGRKWRASEIQESSWKWYKEIEDARGNLTTFGTRRVNMLLGIGKEHYTNEELREIERIRKSRFGLGTKRTLQQAVQFTGINLQEQKMVENKCGNLIWVPFVESPNYGVNEYLDSRSLTGDTVKSPMTLVVPPTSHERKSVASSNDLSGIQSVRVIASVVLTASILFSFFKRQSRRRKGVRHRN